MARHRTFGRSQSLWMLGAGPAPTPPKLVLKGSGAISEPKTTPDPSPALAALSERQFSAIVRAELERQGFVVWVFPIMKLTAAGVPDLTFWSPMLPGRVFFWELKTTNGRVSPKQRRALDHLATVPGIDARVLRPADWPRLRDEMLALLAVVP